MRTVSAIGDKKMPYQIPVVTHATKVIFSMKLRHKLQRKRTSFPFFTFDKKISFVQEHNLLTEGQPYPTTRFLGREKRRKYLLLNIGRHPSSVILDLDNYVVVSFQSCYTDIRFSTIFNRFHCVEQQIN